MSFKFFMMVAIGVKYFNVFLYLNVLHIILKKKQFLKKIYTIV